jgi:UDP-N-acetylmuramate-alanine ligase
MIRAAGHPDARFTGSPDQTVQAVIAGVQPGDVVLLLSAGDLPQIAPRVLDALRGREQRGEA